VTVADKTIAIIVKEPRRLTGCVNIIN
jgi:hypothetical protein